MASEMLAWHGPADKPRYPRGGAVLQHQDVMAEPSKQEIEARAYQFWEQPADPLAVRKSFGTWLNRSRATRTILSSAHPDTL